MSQDPLVPGVVVLGMHRSGTSAVAGALRHAGLRHCDDYWLLPAHEDNPRGYFENRVLVELNDEFLEALDAEWSAPPASVVEPAVSQSFRERARASFHATMPVRRWLWKDPRLCLTLPFWLSVLDVRPAVVVVHRDPGEVVASLQARDGFTPHLGLALWERYTRDLLTNISGLPTVVVSFADVLADPVGSIQQIRGDLTALGVGVDEADEAAVAELISPSLATKATAPAGAGLLSVEQERLLEQVTSLEHRYASFPTVDLAAITVWSTLVIEEHRTHLRERARLLEQLEHHAEDRREMRAQSDALAADNAELDRQVSTWRAKHREAAEAHRQELEDCRAEMEALPRWWRSLRRARQRLGRP